MGERGKEKRMTDTLEILRYEREVLRQLKSALFGEEPDAEHHLSLRGGDTLIRVEEVLLDEKAIGEGEIVILFRDLSRPKCLFRMRMEAVEPESSLDLAYADVWAGVIKANLEEAIVGGS
jgi:hypothetical protein